MLLAGERTWLDGQCRQVVVLEIDDRGRIGRVGDARQLGTPRRTLPGLLIPGLVEPHTDLLAGARALVQPAGRIAPGHWADFVALDGDRLEDLSLPLSVRDVVVGGEVVVEGGRRRKAVKRPR